MKKAFIILTISSLIGITAYAQKQAKVATPEIFKMVLPIHDTRVEDKNIQADKPVLLNPGKQLQVTNVPVQATVHQAPVTPAPKFIVIPNPSPTELRVLAEQEKLKGDKK